MKSKLAGSTVFIARMARLVHADPFHVCEWQQHLPAAASPVNRRATSGLSIWSSGLSDKVALHVVKQAVVVVLDPVKSKRHVRMNGRTCKTGMAASSNQAEPDHADVSHEFIILAQ